VEVIYYRVDPRKIRSFKDLAKVLEVLDVKVREDVVREKEMEDLVDVSRPIIRKVKVG